MADSVTTNSKKRHIEETGVITQSDEENDECEDSDDESKNVLAEPVARKTRRIRRRKIDTQPAFTCERGDFHGDSSLCEMHYDTARNENGKPYSVIIDQSVISGILDHVYSDHTNEVIGLLGGIYDETLNVVHVKHYYASIRDIYNMAVDGVSCDGNEIVKATNLFATKDLSFVGWYHSHPRIPPFPSMKDMIMQTEMQTQAPYAFGIICSAYFNEPEGKTTSDRHDFYFNSFRTRLNDSKELEALRVMSVINEQAHLTSEIQRQMQGTLHTIYRETKETFDTLIKSIQEDNQHGKAKQLFLTSQYQSFMTSFWKDSIMQNNAVLRHDIQALKQHNARLEELLREKQGDDLIESTSERQYDLELARILNPHEVSAVKEIQERAEKAKAQITFDSNTTSDALLLQNMFNDNSIYMGSSGFCLPEPHSALQQNFAYYEKFCLTTDEYRKGDCVSYTDENNFQKFLRITSIALPQSCIHGSSDDQYMGVWVLGDALVPPQQFGGEEQYEGEVVLLVDQAKLTLRLNVMKNITKIQVYPYEQYIQKKFGGDSFDDLKSLYGCSRQFENGVFAPLSQEYFA